ncbi:uncharacterized protein Tco025E_01209 [Trypanosoma conorhini]|uniref:Uncharacterized protein n=1 Tax=Trypanosoma conorhini TaxID=83891 RepID=A0A3R7NSR7_9TRYP|nr:uncharacterized protein Tco025E_01209 [Trypanosoma conorhini]RNF26504.1 hypothetical protein Tco025E_01209 [Trypanosoma conorhini]
MTTLSLAEAWGDGGEKLQGQLPQRQRNIWGRLVIAEVPYPVIAADDVVICLYANRLLFRVSSSAFTVTVFLRDIIRIVSFMERGSIEMEVARANGGHRAYIVILREVDAALMLYDVLLSLLPPHVKDSSVGLPPSQPAYATDYPFALMSPSMMAASGFYELYPRTGAAMHATALKEEEVSTRLFPPSGTQPLQISSGRLSSSSLSAPAAAAATSTAQARQRERQSELRETSQNDGGTPLLLGAYSVGVEAVAKNEEAAVDAVDENNPLDDPHLPAYHAGSELRPCAEGNAGDMRAAATVAAAATSLSWGNREATDTLAPIPRGSNVSVHGRATLGPLCSICQ